MTEANPSSGDAADLQAWIDGELAGEERARMQRRLQVEPALRRQLAVLQRVRDLVDDALQVPVAEQGYGPPARRRRRWGSLLIPAAAAVVVAVALLARPGSGERSASPVENDVLAVRVVPLRGGTWPLFSDPAVRLDLRSKDGRAVFLQSWPPDRGRTELFGNAPPGEVHLALEVSIHLPGGKAPLPARLVLPEPVACGHEGSVDLPLRRLMVRDPAVVPYFALRPAAAAWELDYRWTFGALGAPAVAEWRPFVPETPGEYRLELHLVGSAFAGELRASTLLRVTGAVSEWSEAVDGLRFRIAAAAPELRAGAELPLALQIENTGDEERKYNVMGVTRAGIPQPYHFTLIVDGEDFEQRDDLGTFMTGPMFFVPHPPGTLRTVVVAPSFWQRDGAGLGAMPGEHEVQFRFDFTATAVRAGEPVWQGQAVTPPLRLRVRDD